MTTTTRDTSAAAWAGILARAVTAADHAYILEARRSVGDHTDTAAMVAAYKERRATRVHDPLDTLRVSASRIADLALVVAGGAKGVNAHRLDGSSRRYLAAAGLIVAAPTSKWSATDTRSTVVATLHGIAVVRAAQGRPVDLSDSEAVPLAVIERAMAPGGEHDGCSTWPGSAVALRVAQMWRLIDYVRVPPPAGAQHWSGRLGVNVYRLTPAGREALIRHRGGITGSGRELGSSTAAVLDEVCRSRTPHGIDPQPMSRSAVQRCLHAGWLTEGGPVPGTRRVHVKLTDAGRDALAGWRFRQQNIEQSGRTPTEPVGRLQPGMWVRLAHRRRVPGLGSEFVRVHEIRSAKVRTGSRLAHNYEVWATADDRAEPFLYAGTSHFRTVRFEVRPLAAG